MSVERDTAPSDQSASKRFLKAHLAGGRRFIAGSALATGATTLAIILQAWAVARAIQLVVVARVGLSSVAPWLLVFAAGSTLRCLCSYLTQRWTAEGALRIQHRLRRSILDATFASHTDGLLGCSLAPHGARAAENAHTLLEQVDKLEPYYASYLPRLLGTVLCPLLLLVVIFPADWVSGLILLVTTPVIPFYMALIGKGAESVSRKQMSITRSLSATLLDYLQGMQTIKALGATARAEQRIAEASQELSERTLAVQRIAFLSSGVLEFFSTFAIAILALYIGLSLLNYIHLGSSSMSLQTGLFVLLLAPSYFQPLRAFAAAYHEGVDALGAAAHIIALLRAAPQSRETTPSPESPRAGQRGACSGEMQSIELRHVTLRYPGRISPALCDITISIEQGEKVALVGPSGAGKSSLLAILAGFTGISEGEVYLNGRPRALSGAAHVTWIGQRPYLFPGTLADNIALGHPRATRREIEAAASEARLTDFAAALPSGLDTVIGERGLGISGGEAQRVALARAFLDNAPLLVLDEPTAHLDADAEAALIETIAALARGKTLVLATHSPALLALCERVLPLDEGRLLDPPAFRSPIALPASLPEGDPLRRGLLFRSPTRLANLETIGNDAAASTLRVSRWRKSLPLHGRGPERGCRMRGMLQYLALIRGNLLARFLLGLFLACLASLAAVGLLGLSGWFITTSALVGLLGITTFSFLFPSGGVRAFALLRTAARYGERVVNHQATFAFLARLRVLSFARASRLPPQSIARYRSGDLLTRVMADIDTLDQMLVRILIPTLSTAIVVIGALIFLAGYSALLAACAGIAAIAAAIALPLLMARLGRRPGARFVEARAEARTRFVEALEGRREIASYRAEQIVTQQVGQALTRAEGVQRVQHRDAAISAAMVCALTSLALLGTLLIGLILVSRGTLDGALAVMLYLVVSAVFECIEGLPQAYHFLGRTRQAARRLRALLPEAEPQPRPAQAAKLAPARQEAMSIERVSFRYDEQRAPVFQNLTCVFPAGSLVAITGPSGAGKSTLLKLLAGELEPDQGRVVLGGAPLARTGAEEGYRHLALVSQDSHIFNASLRENLLMAKPDATEREMRDVLEAVCLTRLVEKLADGLDTGLGEHGEVLSGGERRRLSLAQALLRTPSLLLLDEPTTGVDRETARHILSTLRARLPRSTIVVATHEAWFGEVADQHLVLPAECYQSAAPIISPAIGAIGER